MEIKNQASNKLGEKVGESNVAIQVSQGLLNGLDAVNKMEDQAEERRKQKAINNDPMLEWQIEASDQIRMYKLFFIIIFNIICLPSCTKVNPVDNTTGNVQVESLYSEGEKHFLGRDVPQDYKKAFFYFEKAATAGSAAAQNDLAAMLTKGIGADKNPEKALFWLNKAAEQNFPEAQYNLGLMYDSGNYVTKDRKKALEFYQLAAKSGLS